MTPVVNTPSPDQPQTTVIETPTPTEAPIPDATFGQAVAERTAFIVAEPPNAPTPTPIPTTVKTTIMAPTPTPTPTCYQTPKASDIIVSIPTERSDPIVGEWTLQNGPFPCTFDVYDDGSGAYSCGIFPMVQTGLMSWLKDNNGYYTITVSDKTASAFISVKGAMISDALPANSYLVKNG
jgi:hypothetical protein